MALELKFSTSANAKIENFGTGVPAWTEAYANAWQFSNADTDYGYMTNGNTTYIQYGHRDPSIWASMRFWGQSVEVIEERTNPDNSITAKIRVKALFWWSKRVSSNGGYRVDYDIKVNGRTVWSFSGYTTDEVIKNDEAVEEFTVTVAPEERSSASALNINVTYPNGEFDNNNFYVGIFLYNNLKKAVKPWAIRKSGIFKTLNRQSGFFKQRKDGWKDVSGQPTTAVGKSVSAPHRIRKSGQWLGQGQIGQQ
jgi:orf16 protein